MRTKLSLAACIVLAGLWTFQAQTDELVAQEAKVAFDSAQVERELIDTLDKAFEGALNKYKTDVNWQPDVAIRLNEKLYEAQVEAAEQKRQVVEGYLSRAKEIEKIANSRLDQGRGLSTSMLEAKASRLKATLELAALQQ